MKNKIVLLNNIPWHALRQFLRSHILTLLGSCQAVWQCKIAIHERASCDRSLKDTAKTAAQCFILRAFVCYQERRTLMAST